jgi:SlyX protein
MAAPMTHEERLNELELRFTEQAHALEELSDVVFRQQRAIDGLTAELKRLQEKLAAEPGLVDAQRQDKPPHY